jgi:cyclopropane-fatty-acyl-phospholipid synthase
MSDRDALQPLAPARLLTIGRQRDRVILVACRAATRHVRTGRLRLTLPSGETATLGSDRLDDSQPDASLTLLKFRAFFKALSRGSIGFADAYMAGDIVTPDLGAVFRFFLANKSQLDAAGRGQFKVRRPDFSWHRRRDNSRDGSRRNIAAHYDLGNAFYAPWLDASMTYSSALFSAKGQSLEAAQAAKLDRIVEALEVRPGMRVLEIGCGWGALAERLARAACHVTAVTVSQEQHAYATRRIADAGLSDLVEIRFQDYRDIEGRFDRVVSIEMIEAVGEAHWPTYFATIADRLDRGGSAILQAITIDERAFDAYRAKADFIQRFVFPGGMLLTPTHIGQQSVRVGLSADTVLRFGPSYAETLRHWRTRFEAAWPELSQLGFDERFRRMWLYYLIYCETGFDNGRTDVGLYRLAKP